MDKKIYVSGVDKWGNPYVYQYIVEKETKKTFFINSYFCFYGKEYVGSSVKRISKTNTYFLTLTEAWAFSIQEMDDYIKRKEHDLKIYLERRNDLEMLFHAKGDSNA